MVVLSMPADCSWRQTSGCSSTGRREPQNDRSCDANISPDKSGYCECEPGVRSASVGCGHSAITCRQRCSKQPRPIAATRPHKSPRAEEKRTAQQKKPAAKPTKAATLAQPRKMSAKDEHRKAEAKTPGPTQTRGTFPCGCGRGKWANREATCSHITDAAQHVTQMTNWCGVPCGARTGNQLLFGLHALRQAACCRGRAVLPAKLPIPGMPMPTETAFDFRRKTREAHPPSECSSKSGPGSAWFSCRLPGGCNGEALREASKAWRAYMALTNRSACPRSLDVGGRQLSLEKVLVMHDQLVAKGGCISVPAKSC